MGTLADPLFLELRPPLSAEEGILEADRCLECGGPYAAAPCTLACPADVDVPGFIAGIADGDPAEAAATIFDENLLGGTCARVCPVEMLCEGACVLDARRAASDRHRGLQRFATDWALARSQPLRELNDRTAAASP